MSSILLLAVCFTAFLAQVATASNVDLCGSLPAMCWVETNEYMRYVGGERFVGVSYFTEAYETNSGSCGYAPSAVSQGYVIALPMPFMFMSRHASQCNPNCNLLCGSLVEITNISNGKKVQAMVIDTALTDHHNPVMSIETFIALDGDINKGSMPIYFRRA